MRFLMLLWTQDGGYDGGDAEDWEAWQRYETALRDAGVLADGAALEPGTSARRVVPDLAATGDVTVPDAIVAPGADLAGYYVLDVHDAETAEIWAAKAPLYGVVELRPVQSFG